MMVVAWWAVVMVICNGGDGDIKYGATEHGDRSWRC